MIRRERPVLRGRPIYGAEPTSFGGAVQSLATIEPRDEIAVHPGGLFGRRQSNPFFGTVDDRLLELH